MELLTDEIRKTLPALYSNEAKGVEDPMVVLKLFCPWNHWTWYISEGSYVCPNHANYDCEDPSCMPKTDWKQFIFFGLVDGIYTELGYVDLDELRSIRGPFGLKIERDLYWESKPLSECHKLCHGE